MSARPRRAGRVPVLLAACLLAGAAHGDVRIEIVGVDGAVRDNVLAFLSLQRYATLDDLEEDTVQRLFRRAEREVAEALRPFGYYEPRVESELTRQPKRWLARLVVTPGEPVLLRDVDVEVLGPGRDETFLSELLAAERLVPGQRLDHGVYEGLKGELQRRAVANGYLDARFLKSELLVDPAARTAVATLRLETGPRYRFGTTEVVQDVLEPAFVRRFLRFREGDWYSSAALLRTQFALDDAQYFSVVEVLPGDRDRESLTVPIRIVAQPNRRNRYTLGVGYETDFGPRVRARWDNRLVNEHGHRMRVETNLAANNQSVVGSYVVPIGDPALEKVEAETRWVRAELGDTTTTSLAVRPTLTRVLGRWQRATFVDFARTTSEVGGFETTDTLLVPGISFAPVPRGFTEVDPSFGPTRGFYSELIGSYPTFGSRARFLRLRVRDDFRWGFAPGWALLGRGELGGTATANFADVPVQYRFFAGGDRSVRGFGFNALSPLESVPGRVLVDEQGQVRLGPDGEPLRGDAELLRTGGRHLAVVSLELERDLVRNFAVAVFADAGNAFNSWGDPLEYAAGLGVRYKLPFVSVGLDVAKPLSTDGGVRVHLNISPVF